MTVSGVAGTAIQPECLEASDLLLQKMQELPSKDLQTPFLQSALQTVWGAIFHLPDMKDLLEDASKLAQRCFTTPYKHIRGIVTTGDALAMHAALEMLAPESLQVGWDSGSANMSTGIPETLLDAAISSGSPQMAKMVNTPSKATSRELPSLLTGIHRYRDQQEGHRLVARGQIAHFRAYHAVVDSARRANNLAEFLMTACRHDHLDIAQVIWNLAGSDVADHLTDAQKEALVELGGNAAAQGRLEFLDLLVGARAPLDHKPKRTDATMIRRAAMNGQTAAVKLLATAGASPTGALQEAAGFGHIDLMTVLIDDLRVDLNEELAGYGHVGSAAGQACAANQLEALQLLHNKGADLSAREFIRIADQVQSKECMHFLLELQGLSYEDLADLESEGSDSE